MLTDTRSIVFAGFVGLTCGAAGLAAPGQERPGATPGTERPGQPTRAAIFVENRGRSEAIPITAPDPLPVVLEPSAMNQPVVRLAPQPWEYRTLLVPSTASPEELTALLEQPGTEGWEPSGFQLAGPTGTLLVLKRPRP